MLILPNQRAVVLKVSDPRKVLNAIPTARAFVFNGQQFVCTPHGLDESKVLRNLGCNVPSPINYYYSYPGALTPFSHQKATCEFLTLYNQCAVLNQMRTGKTNSCVWASDYLMSGSRIRKALIVAPLSTVDYTWGQALFECTPHRKFVILHGTREKRLKLLKQPGINYYIVNHDGFEIIAEHLPQDIDLVIYDEAAVLRNQGTNRYKNFAAFVKKRPNLLLWLLTGTPTPNAPTDAWALCKLIKAPVPRFTAFRDLTMYKKTQWAWEPLPHANEIVSQYLQPSIMFKRSDCFDLPGLMHVTRKCETTTEQKRALKDLHNQFVTEINGAQVNAANEAVKVQKILQVLLGVVYDINGNEAFIGCQPRVNALLEALRECDDNAIVFVPFTNSLDYILKAIQTEFGINTVAKVNGQISMSERGPIFRDFRDPTSPLRFLVADPRVMAHGLDLSSATLSVWFGPTNSNDVFEQANARMLGPKQTKPATILEIEATEAERKVFNRLRNKQKMQGMLLEMIQQLQEI